MEGRITINETQAAVLNVAIEFCDVTRRLRLALLEENKLRSTSDDCERVLRAMAERARLEQLSTALEADLFMLTMRLQQGEE